MKIYLATCFFAISYAISEEKPSQTVTPNYQTSAVIDEDIAQMEGEKRAIEDHIRSFDWTTKLSWSESYKRYRKLGMGFRYLVELDSDIIADFENFFQSLPDVPWSHEIPCYINSSSVYPYQYGALQGFFLSTMAEHDPKKFEILVTNLLNNPQTSDNRKRTLAIALGSGSDFFTCEDLLRQMDSGFQVVDSLIHLRGIHFGKWDIDSNDTVSLEEYSNAVSAQSDLLARFEDYDLDGDDELTIEELSDVDNFLEKK